MRTTFLMTTAMALMLSVPALGQAQQQQDGNQAQKPQQTQQNGGQQQGQVPQQARQFAEFAAISGMFEVQSSELAQQNAEDQQVQQFAQRMIDDHGKANDQLKQIAQQQGIQLPDQLDAEHQQKLDQLRGASGQDFTRQYIQQQVQGHEQAVQQFQQYAQQGQAQELKTFAQDTVPTLEEHLRTAQDLQQQMQPMASGTGQQQDQQAQVTVIPPDGEQGQQQTQAGQQDQQQADVTVIRPEEEQQAQAERQDQMPQQEQADVTIVQPEEQERQAEGEVAVVEPEAGTQGVESASMLGGIPIDDLMGRSVVGSDGEELGEIEDIILDSQSGEAQQAVLASGGFLGIGEKRIAVDFQDLQIEGDQVLAQGLTQASVEGLETYDYGEDTVSLGRRGIGDEADVAVEETGPTIETEPRQ